MTTINKDMPNIILLILDSARRDQFGCYGHPGGLTPNIDAFAEESLLLSDHYAAGCGSTQAHVGIFLGQHSARNGIVHNFSEMKPDVIALPKMLRELGYKTFGHSLASFIPPAGYEDLFGFDEFYYPGKKADKDKVSIRSQLIETLRKYPSLWTFLKKTYSRIRGEAALIKAAAKNFDGKTSLNFLFKKLKNHKNGPPVFAYTTLLHPHTPYYAPEWCLNHVFNGEPIDPFAFKIQSNLHAWINGDFGSAESAIATFKKLYQAELVYADHLVGAFIQRLKSDSLFNNTLLILISDHGELLGEHGQLNHGMTTWEELYRVPCLIHYAKSDRMGKVFSHLTSNLDILPTVFDLIGEPNYPNTKTQLDGASILDECFDWEKRHLIVDAPPLVLPERLKSFPKVIAKGNVFFRAIRSIQYKYIWMSNGRRFLFPVNEMETPENNILDDKPEIAERMHNKMLLFYKTLDPNFQLNQYPINMGTTVAKKMTNPAIHQELKKLGYL